MKIKTSGKIIILLLVLGIAYGALHALQPDWFAKLVPGAKPKESVVPLRADLPAAPDSMGAHGETVSMPGDEAGVPNKPEVRWLLWAWNAHMGAMFANGGPRATAGSLMAKHGVNLRMERQDDSAKMQEALVAFATDLSQGNPNPSKGAHFVTIMGDGAATFLAGVNNVLKKLGSEYKAKVVASIGYSRGEDKFMGPPSWKQNPTASRGGLVSGYLRDGDWNIAQKWLGDNGLRNNPDEKTWDPDALNWVAANDYIDAAEKYVAGYSETRPVVRNGKKTGETKRVSVQGVVTWTPGDVTVAEKRGGLVSIVSTKEYASQMPCVLIGIDKWMRNNRDTVENMIAAILEGGDAVKASPEALHKACEVSQQVYKEQGADADYWERYYKGAREPDKTGMMVDLGGSYTSNLPDNLLNFGMISGSANLFAATYKTFGDIVVAQYPELVSGYPSVDEILDTSYLAAVAKKAGSAKTSVARAQPTYTPSSSSKAHVLSRKSWNIQFETGKATFSPGAKAVLEKLRRDLLVASGTEVEIHGHTDGAGNPSTNMSLSEARAFAVQKWLESQFPVNFPKSRVKVFAHGQTNPVASNATAEGRAQNRRVEIVLNSGN